MVVVAVGAVRAGGVGGWPGSVGTVCVGGGTVSDLNILLMYLEHAREDYQHARTFCSATGITYTPESIEAKRLWVAELEADLEELLEGDQ